MSEKIWFITGSSRGFGRQFTEAALQRGDKVAATARNTRGLADLVERFGDAVLPLQLDVTDRTQVFEAVAAARERFGRLDVVVNNAGYSLIGAVEDLGEQELRDQLETNVFGVLHVVQAVLPVLREQRSGHIVQISSAMGVATFGGTGGYCASKWALEGMSEVLSQEVAPFGIKVTMIEPGAFATDFASSAVFTAHGQDAYGPLYASLAEMGASSQAPGPEGVGGAILQIVDAEEPPLRVFFGEQPTQWIPAVYQQRLETWAQWAHVSRAAEGK
ncbi:TPA: SDR family NAD(P)-dependent oxidoreductase [Klebsiella oxytoca]|uniref:SDR family NAD(P)-dependent oxidoreductase n=1 Tax=Klebsiella oxytoca TaxID=571 RepID=UPI001DEF4042|nr:SDR family NAD(P)-dependent oxidoreductase [Klebsiella oxytoca]ELW9511694.1 SDR family NAD(P)-dependent oxidoreductase [Klebsiella oxytoca]MBS6494348.1 SDR family NAD(P)-dependent oxidoreductase [Klebsiella oxytoca]MDU1511243.1 SDR family NAD(P)-dependent oxidoreductase [Klebsiella oxytoca]MDU5134519.1 SDR family NAD(P)-dependent oxidoreductase [Klebsiella oxytoca]